jgi:hypothetical protein
MAALYNAGLKSLTPGVYTNPYQHATKLFLADNFRLAPKQSFLYYVIFNFDPALSPISSGLGAILSFAEKYQSFETGMLVKKTDLPKFAINTKTVNAYNRKNILQTGLTYENLQMVFHDDAADVITNFWNDYYTYYFRDSDYAIDQYRNAYRYNLRSLTGWGFMPRNQSIPSFFSNIRIFSLHNKRFTEYMLINPVITAWKHGDLDSKESTGLLENTMTIAFETVKYFTGYINPVNVDGFSLLHYDNTRSPISTSTTNIYSDSGILGALDGIAKDLRKPDGSDGSGGVISSLLSMYRAYNNVKNINLKNVVGSTVAQLGAGVLGSVLNGTNSYVFPTSSSNTYIQGSGYNPPTVPSSGISGGASRFNIGTPVGTAISVASITAAATRGVATASGSLAGALQQPIAKVYDTAADFSRKILVSGSLQTQTGTTTSYYLDEQGNPISEFTSRNTTGKYDPSDPSSNLRYVETVYDSEGTPTVLLTYADGTVRTEDADGNLLGIQPGNNSRSRQININPESTASLAANGQTQPRGGLQVQTVGNRTQVVGGATTGYVNSTLATGLGLGVGALTGAGVYSALQKTGLNNTIIGRVVNTAFATTVGGIVGTAVKNGATPILNDATKNITQFFDGAGEKIKSIVGSWTGTGGYDPSRPTDNIVSTIEDTDPISGEVFAVTTYKDGTVVTENAEGEIVSRVKGTNNRGLFDFSVSNNSDINAQGPSPGVGLVDGSGNAVYSGHGEVWNYQEPGTDFTIGGSVQTDDGWGSV